MNLLTQEQRTQLQANGKLIAQNPADPRGLSLQPVVKLFHPATHGLWLLTAMETKDDQDVFYGLCYFGHPELGTVSLDDLANIRVGTYGVMQDADFAPTKTLGEYAVQARQTGRVYDW